MQQNYALQLRKWTQNQIVIHILIYFMLYLKL
jgi:hypothetical protein